MAAKKKGGGRKKGAHRRSNPGRKHKGGARRRRNPANGFGDRVMRVAGAGVAALAAGALGLVVMSKFQPGQPVSTYGVPAVGVLAGAALMKKWPTVGFGVAAGSLAAPFALPLASKALASMPASSSSSTSTTTTTTTPAATAAATTNGIAAARLGMGAVHMGAVHMGAPQRFQYRYAT